MCYGSPLLSVGIRSRIRTNQAKEKSPDSAGLFSFVAPWVGIEPTTKRLHLS